MKPPTVRLSFPAQSGYLTLARTAVRALCARLDFPIDRLDDTTLAVSEACTLLLADACEGSVIDLRLTAETGDGLLIEATTRTVRGRPPRQNSFTWTVLTALVDSVDATADAGLVTIRLRTNPTDSADPTDPATCDPRTHSGAAQT
ncbi:MAG: anti-sigma regulatory factor [Actinomycetes bacterium]